MPCISGSRNITILSISSNVFWKEPNIKNYPGWSNEQYRLLVQKAVAATDALERMELVEAAEEVLIDEMPLSPIYHWSNPIICQPWVNNMLTTPSGAVLFERFRLSPR